MSDPRGTILRALRALVTALRPLEVMLADANSARALLIELGVRVPLVPLSLLQLRSLVQQLSAALTAVEGLLAGQDETSPQVLAKIGDLGTATADLFRSLHDLPPQLQAELAAYPDLLAEVDAAELAKRLSSRLLIEYLRGARPEVFNALMLLGLIEVHDVEAGSDYVPAHTRYEIRADRLRIWFTDPSAALADIYGWGTTRFDHRALLARLQYFLLSLGYPSVLDRLGGEPVPDSEAPPPGDVELHLPIFSELTEIAAVGLDAVVRPTVPPDVNDTGLLLTASATGKVATALELTPGVLLTLGGDFEPTGGIGLEVRPPFRVQPVAGPAAGTQVAAHFAAELALRPGDGSRIALLDQPGLLALDIAGVATKVVVGFNTGTVPVLQLEASLLEGLLAIGVGETDGFLQTILPDKSMRINFDVAVGFSSNTGVYFRGSSTLEIHLPTHIEIGPISVEGLTIAIKPRNGKTPLTLGTDIKGSLGPIVAVVQNMGAIATLSFPPNNDGNLGPLQLDIGFKPPNGVGLSVDTGVIKGGGFLYLDADKGEYMGALELDFQNMFSLKAIGIINTKMPDGSKGFALLIIITAEFSPIQLSFGFTLNGVGGLLGLNRTTRIEVLREGIKTNAIKSILFPEDVVANISRIVSDIKQVFPPQVDRFIIGPMAKIGWGTPSIITLELGLLLEIPVPRIAILGVLKALLPEEDTALLRLQVNFLGVIDFENRYISFDASLYDSRLLVYTLTGDMAFRLSWGDNPLFILSVGGFHPSFRDVPADLTRMTRITLSLLSGNNPRITIQCYFAVTSNTVQFGAKAELYAAAHGFNVYGFIGYDVLFQVNPFHFIAAIYAGLALRRGTSVLMSIHLSGELAGPTPWDVRGEASFSILWFDVTISFHETWGDRAEKIEPEKIDVLARLTAEVNDNRNWKAEIPANNNLHVSIKKIEQPADKIIIHPFGVLTFSERLVPLNITINKFGNKIPKDVNKFELTEIRSGATSLRTQEVKEQFARPNFIEMKDNEKLSNPSFELMPSGFKITASAVLQTARTPVSKSVDYELTYLRRKTFTLSFEGIYKLAKGLFKMAARGSAVAKSSLSYQNNRISRNAPEAVAVLPGKYIIANVSNMQKHSPELVADSYTEASELYRELITKKPELKNQVQILSEYELGMN